MDFEDPLTHENLIVNDVASARFALKIANELYFSIKHMREEMERELARSKTENTSQIFKLLKPYVDPDDLNFNRGVTEALLKKAPAYIRTANDELNAALVVETQRAQAEFDDNKLEAEETRAAIERSVADWFLTQFQLQPYWLRGEDSIRLGGCTLTCRNDHVSFVYSEAAYE